jgi:hypothetical protein
MSAITKEQAKDLRNAFQCWQQDYDPVEDKDQYDMFGLGMVAMDVLLASLETEPVAWLWERDGKRDVDMDNPHDGVNRIGAKKAMDAGWKCSPLYPAPPAPVSVPDEATPENIEILASTFAPRGVTYQWDRDECNAAADSWNACHAAMLRGAEPVTTAYKLPANTPCKEAPEHIWLQTAGVWPENGEFSELTWCSDNQHPDDTLYVRADVVTGNSPVIPDGWVACSEQMPEDEQEVIVQNKMGYRYVSYFDEHSGLFFDMRGGNQMNCIEHIFVTHWMPLPAAPKKE